MVLEKKDLGIVCFKIFVRNEIVVVRIWIEDSFLLCRGFNNVVNGFGDDGWEVIVSDGLDDVIVMFNVIMKFLEG